MTSAEGSGGSLEGRDRLGQLETVLLYGMSAGRCAKCKRPVVRESEVSGKAFNIGKRAHIVGRSKRGPRGDARMPTGQRRDLRNHVLLCGGCHDEVDVEEESWPVERLQELRASHLEWVAQLDEHTEVDHERIVYAEAMDAACELVGLDRWAAWTNVMLHPYLSWQPAQVDAVGEFLRRMSTTDWPGTLVELEVALTRLAYLVGEAATTFARRADMRDGDLHVFRRYKQTFNPNYDRDHEAFTAWLGYYEGLIVEATKAAEWGRTAWQSAGNPDFLRGERIHIVTGPHADLRDHIVVLEYTDDEREALLAAGRGNIKSVPTISLDFSERSPSLEDLVLRALADVTWHADPDVVTELATRIRTLHEPFAAEELFARLPGYAPRPEEWEAIVTELVGQCALRAGDDWRTLFRGALPDE